MRDRFLQFENADVTKRIGLLRGKPDMKPVAPQDTQIIDLKRQVSIRIFSILNSVTYTSWLQIGVVTKAPK